MATGGGADDDYDWNIPSKLYYCTNVASLEPGQQRIQTGPESTTQHLYVNHDQPTDPADIVKFISDYNLHHGDLVDFGDYRQTGVVYVNRDVEGEWTFVQNRDDGSAGYLTIPTCVLENVTDAMAKFKDVQRHMEEHNQQYNMHVSHRDKVIRDRFGDVPEGFVFDIVGYWPHFIEFFNVERPRKVEETGREGDVDDEDEDPCDWQEEVDDGLESHEFDWETVTWQQILEAFNETDNRNEESDTDR